MAANDNYGYLRNPSEMENSHPRLPSAKSAEPRCKALIFGTLFVMGLLQVASSVVILLHLTGYLHEVDFSSVQRKSLEAVQAGPILAGALKDPRKKDRSKCGKNQRDIVPVAHLPIRAPIDYVQKGEIQAKMIQWNEAQGHLEKFRYHNGRILVQEGGLYYIYAKTCFRYYDMEHEAGSASGYLQDGNTQLIQYIYHERHTQNPIKPIVLMKSGSTKRWKTTDYNMYCEQQGGTFALKEGDGLYVRVSNPWMLDPEAEGSYFGAFKISK
ncbi:tumor necrosis factor ligand superfamily member 11-like [Megalops cyprinoides]|uniref:tumor necrosis factor ligand superfamily member 11-like n=1 Tax=Megalops cyprinoides TaxID=118141 RepID=UPI001864C42B|nr:tumor necrosis factor ligand superfamily member 11-like [Megalops cyprinoides]